MNQSDLNSSLVRDTAVKKEKQKNKRGKLQSQRDQRIMLFHRDIPIELKINLLNRIFFNSLMLAAGPLQVL